jgi:cytoskeletal protein CcmA (bactofilin family)
MATYTSANAIKKISTGDESGTWGDSTNNNFDIIDRAANGFVSIALSGTSYTLSLSTTAVLSDGHYKAINFTGTPGGTCTVTLEQNDKARLYMILNSTDQSLSITQGSGANVTIATTKSAIVLADGAGSGAAVTDFTAVLSSLTELDVTAGTVSASKAVVVDSNKDITGFRNVTMTGELDAATLDISGAVDIDGAVSIAAATTIATNNKIQFRDAAIYVQSSADGQLDIVADTEVQIAATTIDINGAVALNGAITGATNITLSGELDAATLDISGDADIDGTLETDALSLNGTAVTSTAAELNIMDGGTSASAVTVVDADQIVLNDNGTMKQITVSSLKTYSDGETAWVNFNGTGTVAIRANANVSGITDNGTGDYTLAFSPVFSDADYIGTCGTSWLGAGVNLMVESTDGTDGTPVLKSTSEINVSSVTDSNNHIDLDNQYWNFIR